MKFPFFFRTAMHNRGRRLMNKWARLVEHFGDGNAETAERLYPRLISCRQRAMRLARKLRQLSQPSRQDLRA